MQTNPAAIRRVPPKKPAPQPKRPPMTESSDILAESQEMIATLQEKIQQVFYRFGMAGLERLDEAIIDTCQQMMYPDGVPQSTRRAPAKAALAKPAARPQPQQQQPRRPQTATEIAAAALRSMPPMYEEVKTAPAAKQPEQPEQPTLETAAPMPAMDSSRRAFNPLTDMAPPKAPTQTDFMAQFAGERLSEEELAILQQGLAQEAN